MVLPDSESGGIENHRALVALELHGPVVVIRVAVVQGPGGHQVRVFENCAERVGHFGTGVAVSKRSLEEILPDAALDFNAFYQQRSVATAAGSILVAAVDGKGIPMVKPCGAQPRARLTKGQKGQ